MAVSRATAVVLVSAQHEIERAHRPIMFSPMFLADALHVCAMLISWMRIADVRVLGYSGRSSGSNVATDVW